MKQNIYNNNAITIVDADEGKYLSLKNLPSDIDVSVFGRPIRIIFDNSAGVPELDELDIEIEQTNNSL